MFKEVGVLGWNVNYRSVKRKSLKSALTDKRMRIQRLYIVCIDLLSIDKVKRVRSEKSDLITGRIFLCNMGSYLSFG